MPTVESTSVYEVKLNAADLNALSNGETIEVDVGQDKIMLTSKGAEIDEDDVGMNDLAELTEDDDGDGGLQESVADSDTELDENVADGEARMREKKFTNEEVEVGNEEENLSGMVSKNPHK